MLIAIEEFLKGMAVGTLVFNVVYRNSLMSHSCPLLQKISVINCSTSL